MTKLDNLVQIAHNFENKYPKCAQAIRKIKDYNTNTKIKKGGGKTRNRVIALFLSSVTVTLLTVGSLCYQQSIATAIEQSIYYLFENNYFKDNYLVDSIHNFMSSLNECSTEHISQSVTSWTISRITAMGNVETPCEIKTKIFADIIQKGVQFLIELPKFSFQSINQFWISVIDDDDIKFKELNKQNEQLTEQIDELKKLVNKKSDDIRELKIMMSKHIHIFEDMMQTSKTVTLTHESPLLLLENGNESDKDNDNTSSKSNKKRKRSLSDNKTSNVTKKMKTTSGGKNKLTKRRCRNYRR